MKTGKRIVSVFLVVLMLLTAAPLAGFVGLEFAPKAKALAATGQCGENVFWNFDSSTGALTISGTGKMWDYSTNTSPFHNNPKIKSLTIQTGVTSIGDDVFSECRSLTSATIPDTVTSIGYSAFYKCHSLMGITIPGSVTSIYFSAFSDCTSLTSVIIPDSVTSIGGYAFYYCSSLTSVSIGSGVMSIIDVYMFLGCNLTNIFVNESNQNYASDGTGCLYNKDKTELILYPTGNSRTSFSIPNSVTSIGEYAFFRCSSLKSLTIPDCVTNIGESAFSECSNLIDVHYSGSEERWNKVAIDFGNECLTSATIHFDSSGDGESIQYPFSYDFYRDSYPFDNKGAVIERKHYSNLYAPAPAWFLYNYKDDYQGGLCYGYAFSTAAIYNHLPSISCFVKADGSSISSIREMNLDNRLSLDDSSSFETRLLESKKVGKFFTLKDFVIYCFIYQFSLNSALARRLTENKLVKLYETVKEYVESDKIGVAIAFEPKAGSQGGGEHEVLAIGIKDNNIIVDESNRRGKPLELVIDGNTWHYGPPEDEYMYNSEEHNFYFQTDYDKVYKRLTAVLQAKAPKKNNEKSENVANKLGSSDLLLSIEGETYTIDKGVYEVSPSDRANTDNNSRVFWVEDSNEIQVRNLENDGKVTAAMGESILSASVGSASTIDFKIENKDTSILVKTHKGSETVLELSEVDEELNEYKVAITGTANADTIQANKMESGYKVSGLNDVLIEYIVNDVVIAETSANVSDGKEFNITINSDENTMLTDLEEPHTHTYTATVATPATCTEPGIMTYTCVDGDDAYTETIPALGHTDSDNDGHCDNCGEQMTGGDHCKFCGKIHNGGFFDKLTGFFHKIFAIFKR